VRQGGVRVADARVQVLAAAAEAGYPDFVPDGCLINRYERSARLSLHQDKNERDFTAPIVSVSLGVPAIFLFGGALRSDRPRRVRLENGDVIVVYREQRHPVTNFYGEEAVVRLKTGQRYLKTVERGKAPNTVNLTSFNAKPINGVKLEWIGEICVALPRAQIARMRARAGGKSRKGSKGSK